MIYPIYYILKSLLTSDLSTIQEITSIIGSFSLILAVSTYYYKKRQDTTLATIDQVKFFRETVIPKWSEVIKIVHAKHTAYGFPPIKIEKNSFSGLKTSSAVKFNKQLSIFFDKTKLPMSPIDNSILDEQIFLLNMVEEFSLRVDHLKTINHSALESTYYTFCELVEKNAVALFFMRDIVTNNPIYSSTLKLYAQWESRVNSPDMMENLRKNNLL